MKRAAVAALLSLAVGCSSAPPKHEPGPQAGTPPPRDPAIAIVKTDKPKEEIHLPAATPEIQLASAQHAVAAGKYGEARASLDQAIGMKPDYAEAYLLRGNIAALQGKSDVAYADYDQAVRWRPDLLDPLVARAQAELALDRFDEAVADLDRAIMMAPKRASLHYQKALALFAHKDDVKALAAVNQALAVDPTHEESSRLRAQLDLFAKDYEKAIEDASRAIELAPKDARAWATRGKARAMLGRKSDAKADLEKALALDASLTDELRPTIEQLRRETK